MEKERRKKKEGKCVITHWVIFHEEAPFLDPSRRLKITWRRRQGGEGSEKGERRRGETFSAFSFHARMQLRLSRGYARILIPRARYRGFPFHEGVAVIAPSASLCYDQFCILPTLSRRYPDVSFASPTIRGRRLVHPRVPRSSLLTSLFLASRKEGCGSEMSRRHGRSKYFTVSCSGAPRVPSFSSSLSLSLEDSFFSARARAHTFCIPRGEDDKKCTRKTHLALSPPSTLQLVCAEAAQARFLRPSNRPGVT